MGSLTRSITRGVTKPLTRAITDLGAGGGGGFSILSVFAGGQPGLWADPSDFATLYQDAAGTVPVTAVEQPDGLALDKRLGLVRGPALVTDFGQSTDYPLDTFAATASGFTGSTTTSKIGAAVSLVAQAYAQSTYEITYTIGATSTPFFMRLVSSRGGGQTGSAIVPLATTPGTWRAMLATGSAGNYYVQINNGGAAVSSINISNISVRELPGNHLSQATTTARPMVKADGSITYLKFDGVDDGLSTATSAAGTLTADMDCFIAVRRDSAANAAMVVGQVDTSLFGLCASGAADLATQGAGLVSTYHVNGAAVPGGVATTAGQLHTALPAGAWAVLEVRNLNLSAWTNFKLSLLSAARLNGAIGGVVLCPAQDAATRTKIRQALAAKVGVTI